MAGIYSYTVSEEHAVAKIGILIIENDEANQSALRQLLDSEGWQVRVVPVVSASPGGAFQRRMVPGHRQHRR